MNAVFGFVVNLGHLGHKPLGFGKQLHSSLSAEKAGFKWPVSEGRRGAAGPVSDPREEKRPSRHGPLLRYHGGPRTGAVSALPGHAWHFAALLSRLPSES